MAVRKFSKDFYVVAGIGILLLVVFAVIGGRFASETLNNQSDGKEPVASTPVDRTLLTVIKKVDAKSSVSIKDLTRTGAQSVDGSLAYDFAPYQLEGYAYKTLPVSGKGSSFAFSADQASVYFTKISDALRSSGLIQKSKNKADAGGLAFQKKYSISIL